MADDEAGEQGPDLVAQTVAGFIVGGASLVHPEVALTASTAAPTLAYAINRLIKVFGQRRTAHAKETLGDAAQTTNLPVEQFIEKVLADDKHTELLVRALTAAQDVSLRYKRRALGRALASGVDGGSTVNDEFLFIRALADLDEPHIVILQLIGTQPPINHPLPRGWLHADIVKRLPDYTAALPAILATLELHTLIANSPLASETGYQTDVYTIAQPGRVMLSRLTEAAP